MKKNIYFYTNLLAWGLVLFLISNYVFGWTTPSANAPSANLPAPINVSSTAQSKEGYLAIGTSTAPSYPLDVVGTIQVTGLKMTTGAGADKVLKSDASGMAFWGTASDTDTWITTQTCSTDYALQSVGKTSKTCINKVDYSDVAYDLSCTNCIGTTEIADSYVLNTSDTMSGTLTVAGGTINNPNSSYRWVGGSGWNTFHTPSGYIQLGPANTTWAHIYTDRANFYFNKDLYVLGTQVVKNSGTWGISITGNAATASDVSCTNCLTSTEVASADLAYNLSCTGCVAETEIAQNTLDDSEIQDNSLTAASLAPNACGNSELIDSPTFSTVTLTGLSADNSTLGNIGGINISDGDGRGIKFWNGGANYAIYMSDADPDRGGVTGYSITSKMNDADGRGFRWCNENECGMSLESYTGQWDLNVANDITAGSTLTVGSTLYANNGIVVDGKTVIDNGGGWHRSYGATGWYNGTYGGGWYMTDSTYIRNYGSKQVLLSNNLHMNNHKITNLATPTASTDAATKGYVDDNIGGWSAPSSVTVTSATHNGSFGGYNGMYNWIQTNGCSGYHVCSTSELFDWLQKGGSAPSSTCWLNHPYYEETGKPQNCNSWGSSNSSYYAVVWYSSFAKPRSQSCNLSSRVCCCK